MSAPTRSSARRLGVALTGHWLSVDATLRLAEHADQIGFDVILVDGDETAIPRRPEAPLWDTTALCAAVLQRTRHAHVGAIRLPGFVHPVLLARQLATLEALAPGRTFAFFGVGSGRHLSALGLEARAAKDRVALLEETLRSVRSLLTGEARSDSVGAHHFENARANRPARHIPFVVAAAGPRSLRVACAHADVWDANVAPVPSAIAPLRETRTRSIETWLWVFTRPEADWPSTLADYRKLCPWFAATPDDELEHGLLFGGGDNWATRLSNAEQLLGVDLWVLDLVGLDEARARRALDIAANSLLSG